MSGFEILSVEPGETGVFAALAAVHDLFEAERSVALVPAGDSAAVTALNADAPLLSDQPSLLLTTSGSSNKRGVELTVTAISQAAAASAEHFHNQAVWLTCLPVTGIGGLNTLVRSALAGTAPVIWPGVAGAETFTAAGVIPYIKATRTGADKQRLAAAAALVPTQLHRIAESAIALSALATLDYVLVGGGPTPTTLQQRVIDAGVSLVRTYGMTETCGGVVYDGKPLAGISVEISETGEVLLNTPTLATGYRNGQLLHNPWATGDLGEISNGVLQISGRKDDVVKVAGHKVNLAEVTSTLRLVSGISEVAVVSKPDDEYGHIPIVAYVGQASIDSVRHAFLQAVFELRLPVEIHSLAKLPMLANGKVDRQAVANL